MKKLLVAFAVPVLLIASSCQKCYQCNQYCAYCVSSTNPGIVYKSCAASDAYHVKVDSIKIAFQNSGYSCSLLNNDKKVCDGKNKINDAVNYYILEDYYCYPAP